MIGWKFCIFYEIDTDWSNHCGVMLHLVNISDYDVTCMSAGNQNIL